MTAAAEFSLTELAALLGIARHELDYRVKRGRLAVFRPSGNPRGKRKVTLEAVMEAYPEVYESLLQRASAFGVEGEDRC
jgi:hypothetical protein